MRRAPCGRRGRPIRHVDDAHYLARPAAGYGEAAAGDHLQLGWAFWLVGHQLERGASPFADPYSFRPEAEAPPSLQGWLLRAPLLAARRGGRGRVGVQPDRPALVRPRGRDGVLVAARARALACGRARRRPRLLPDALPGRPVDGPPARAHLVPPAGDAARARAAPIRRRRRLSGGDPALGPAPPRAGGDPARARLRVGAHAAGRLVEGGHRCRGCARRGSGRRPLGRRGLDRHRPLVRPGRPVLGGGLGLRHARASGAASRSWCSSAG